MLALHVTGKDRDEFFFPCTTWGKILFVRNFYAMPSGPRLYGESCPG